MSQPKRDRYDQEVERLQALPLSAFDRQIETEWAAPSPLFRFLSPQGYAGVQSANVAGFCGCPTQVKAGKRVAYTPELTQFVRALAMPEASFQITPDNLTVFAMIQREADRMLGREPPAMLED